MDHRNQSDPLVSRTELPDCIAWTTETKVTPWCHGLNCQTVCRCCPTASDTGDKQSVCLHQHCQPVWGRGVGGAVLSSYHQCSFPGECCAALRYLSVYSLCWTPVLHGDFARAVVLVNRTVQPYVTCHCTLYAGPPCYMGILPGQWCW